MMFILVSSKDSDTTYMYWWLARPSQQLHTNEGKIWIENNMYCCCCCCCGASSNLAAAIFFCSNDNSVSTNKHDTHTHPRVHNIFYICIITIRYEMLQSKYLCMKLCLFACARVLCVILAIRRTFSSKYFGKNAKVYSIYQVNGFSLCFRANDWFRSKTDEVKQVTKLFCDNNSKHT